MKMIRSAYVFYIMATSVLFRFKREFSTYKITLYSPLQSEIYYISKTENVSHLADIKLSWQHLNN